MSAKVERLVNLTVALLEARRPLSLHELRERTGYYQQRDAESARRMFERDKDALRSLGVPIRTETDVLTGESGYIVDRRDYELPDLDLDREEVAALAVALQVSGQTDDRLALSKLAARAPDPLDADGAPATRLELGASAVDDVADALVRRRTIRFAYRTGQGRTATRTVDPYGVGMRRGSWYVVGHDHDRDDVRAFRIDRVDGPIATVSDDGAFEVPAGVDVAAHVAGPAGAGRDVRVAVADDVGWAARAHGGRETGERHDGWPVFAFDGADPARLVPWILGLGPDAVVLDPDDVRDTVVRRLQAARP